MKTLKQFVYRRRTGAALIVSMIFLLIFSALAVSLAAVSGTNLQLASNQHKANLAFCAAQSGLEIMRYCLTDVEASGSDKVHSVYLDPIFQTKLAASNILREYDGSAKTITIPIVLLDTLDTTAGQNFCAVISPVVGTSRLQMKITGSCGDASKQIIVDYNVVPYGNGVFDYGVATKGTMSMTGKASIDDVNITVKSGVYIEGDGTASNAFSSTHNTSVAGDVSIADKFATVSVGGSVGGVQGGIGHVHIGAPEVDFPTPDPQHFLQYATGPQITSGTTTSHGTFNNAIIKAGSTVTFASDTTINGVLYIEFPANVSFAGKVTINGIIAGAGVDDGHNGTSPLKFSGQVVSNDVSTLPDSYGAIKHETGTFICAPGFALEFTGQNLNMGGAIAGNGISFSGQAGGVVKNSIINYSKDADSMTMVGQGNLTFNRSGRDTPPAGFGSGERLDFMPNSYSESL